MKSFLSQEKPASLSSSFMNSVIPLMFLPPPGAVPTLSHAASSSPETDNNMKVPHTLYQLTERPRDRSNGCAARSRVHQAANNHRLWWVGEKKMWWSYGQLICVIHFPLGCKSVAVLPTWFIALRRSCFKIPRISPGILLAAEMTLSLLGHSPGTLGFSKAPAKWLPKYIIQWEGDEVLAQTAQRDCTLSLRCSGRGWMRHWASLSSAWPGGCQPCPQQGSWP